MKEEQFQESLFTKYVQITFVVALYWIVSITLVFINKHLLSGESVKLNAPLFITFFQCLCSLILCIALFIHTKRKVRQNASGLSALCPSLMKMREVLPLSVVFVCMITFNNLALRDVGVAFYFVGRSLTTVFNVCLTYIILGQKTSGHAIAACAIIVFGFFLGVDQESVLGTLSVSGVAFGIFASLFVALNSIYTKFILPSVNDDLWMLMFYNNINALILFVPLMLMFGEPSTVWNFQRLHDIYFWGMMTLSGFFGFAIGFVNGLQIKVTSPLTHNVSGTAKACAQTIIACIWYNELKSATWWLSNIMVMAGSVAYARVKQLEMIKNLSK